MRNSKPSTRFLKRHLLASDEHPFIGRIIDLSIVSLYFDSYEELSRHPDCLYALEVDSALLSLTQRVESLNLVGNMLWPEPFPTNFKDFPITRHEWLTVGADTFLMRYVSVVDCALLLVNSIIECGLSLRSCTLKNLRKARISSDLIDVLSDLLADQGYLRDERNSRFHHGHERGFTSDDSTFRLAAKLEKHGRGLHGTDSKDRPINVIRSFKEGLVELQRDFNASTRLLVRRLDKLYDLLAPEFETRFSPRFKPLPFKGGAKGT